MHKAVINYKNAVNQPTIPEPCHCNMIVIFSTLKSTIPVKDLHKNKILLKNPRCYMRK